ncbi:MAG: DUF5132 domain-containing protein [Chloroflexi bacterium]|nr:DUF5132 domain-containing protein [Chloroflexota bacterium]
MSTRNVFLIGLAGALTGGALGSGLRRGARPLVVRVLKEGFKVRENLRTRIAELREDLEDIAAAVEHEYRMERRAAQGETPREGV